MQTDVVAFIQDMDGGVVEQKLGAILSEVAEAVINHDRKGQVVLTIDMTRIGNSYQVEVHHKLSYKMPTARGTKSEDNSTSTPFNVNKRGKLTLFPEDQGQLFTKTGEVNETGEIK